MTATVVAEDGVSPTLDHIEFDVRVLGLQVAVVRFEDPDSASAGDWNALLRPEGHTIEFCNSNGVVAVSSDGQTITFEVGKYGAGGDGTINVPIPIEACRAAINSVKVAVAEVHRRRACTSKSSDSE